MRLPALLIFAAALIAQPLARTPVSTFKVVKVYPHDRTAFTQGLQYADGVLYEGTGINGKSSLRKVDLNTGVVQQQVPLPGQYFGEGITVFGNQILQLTWTSGVAFVYDRASFKALKSFRYPGEGWGLTHDGHSLIMSDGTNELRYLDPNTFAEKTRIRVLDGNIPVRYLNELEFVKGEILANIWQTDRIARIHPITGRVTGYIDLTSLLPPPARNFEDVLNGIAYDAKGDRLFVTGKLWPKLFEIKLVPPAHPSPPR